MPMQNTFEWQLQIKFIEPSGPPMFALGDKIGSTIIAQSSGVSCIAWNGSDEYNREAGCLPKICMIRQMSLL